MKRIHELAKEQGVDQNAIIDILKRAGLPASKCTPSSTISEDWEKRLAKFMGPLREQERRRVEKEQKEAMAADKAKPKAPPAKATGTAVAPPPEKPEKKPAHGKAPAAERTPPTVARGGSRKPSVPQPKRWTDDGAEIIPAAAPELDAWVDASARERKPSKKELREQKKSERLPVISGEEVSALDDIPRTNLPGRPLTDEEILRGAGLDIPPAPTPEPIRLVAEPARPAARREEEAPGVAPEPAPEPVVAVAPKKAVEAPLPVAVEVPAPAARKPEHAPARKAESKHEPKHEPKPESRKEAPVGDPAPAAIAPPAPSPIAAPAAVTAATAPATPPPAPLPAPTIAATPVPASAPAPQAAPEVAAAATGRPKTEAELRAERRAEKARIEKEREDWLRSEKARVEAERAARTRVEREREEAIRLEKEKADKEKAEKERVEREKAEKERLKKEQRDRERQARHEVSPAAAALAASLEAKRKQAHAAAIAAGIDPATLEDAEAEDDGSLIGDVLLGDIPQEDEEIAAAVGLVPEGPTKKGPIPIVRRDKGPAKTAVPGAVGGRPGAGVKTGFTQGGGFALAGGRPGADAPGRGAPGRSVGAGPAPQAGARGGKQFIQFGPGRAAPAARGAAQAPKPEKPTKVTVTPPFTVKELSLEMGVKVPDIIRQMMRKGKMITLNTALPEELALEIGMEFNVEVEVAKKKEAEDELANMLEAQRKDKPEDLLPRAPVVTILGHVDHGKTSLLDKIRNASVAAGEAGGITQHIGAYKVQIPDGRSIVFVDTPGHQAFTEMRARGANVTDVVVLVVAADDGVMPQTEEAYNHAKAAGVPIVVALNKIDKPSAQPNRVKQQLASMGLQPVEWGGTNEVCEVSALTGKGIPEFLEILALQSDVLELKANPEKQAGGTCLEARVSEGRGIVAHLLVQEGTMQRGDVIVCGSGYGRVRAIFDDRGRQIKTAGPSTPVEVIGLEEVPEAGARFYVIDELAKAKEIATERIQRQRASQLAERVQHLSLDNIFERMKSGKSQEVRVVLKADVRGSIEVLQKEIPTLSTSEVKVRILHAGVGGITDADIQLADASDAFVIGFNVVPDEKAKASAELKGVDVRSYRIIYAIIDDLKKAMEGLLAPEEREVSTAQVEIRKIFKASTIGTIAGCFVKSGKVERGNRARLIRDGVIKFDGEIAGLRRLKDDVKEVREGFECGITLKNYNDILEGDRIETYAVEKFARSL